MEGRKEELMREKEEGYAEYGGSKRVIHRMEKGRELSGHSG